jgi:hypothetical membrane protein
VGSAHRVAATISMVGVVVYVVVDVVLQLLPPHYSVISQAESDLAVGPFGWIMSINFFGRGITSAALIVTIATTAPRTRLRTLGVWLLAVAGFCSALIAFFPTDIPSGEGIAWTTPHGLVHTLGASTGFVLALAAFWVLSFWLPTRPRAADAFLGIASLGLIFLAVAIVALPGVLGLAERICLVGILGWVFVVAGHLRTRRLAAA